MGILTSVGRHAALHDIGLEVGTPCLVPECLDIQVDAEPCCGPVVRVGQHLSRNRALRSGESSQDPIRIGEDEHAAGVEEHGDGRIAAGDHAQNLPRWSEQLVVGAKPIRLECDVVRFV